MAERAQLNVPSPPNGGLYFASPKQTDVFSSGCTLLDCVLGGGYAEGRFCNIVGDKSTGKTLLAIEACASFARKYPNGKITYAEAEAAFDAPYAEALGFPLERVDFVSPCFTVEEWYADVIRRVGEYKKTPHLYIVDSLDALSTKSEREKDLEESSSYADKAKLLSEIFRRLVQDLENSNTTLIVISQERDNIGVTFGKKSTRSGGRALDFYASQILWLAHRGQLKRTISGVERSYGIEVAAKAEKNKIGLPFRSCEFRILFGYGIDDIAAGLVWLEKTKKLDRVGLNESSMKKLLSGIDSYSVDEIRKIRTDISNAVRTVWTEIETEFLPTRTKANELRS